MAIDNPFNLDQADESQPADSQRVRRLKQLGPNLRSLASLAAPDTGDFSQEPMYGGATGKDEVDLSRNKSISPDIGEPSYTATERVQRAPALEQNASALLPREERVGNLETGEEGGYGPLSGPQRSLSLKDFFGDVQKNDQQPDQGEDVGGASGASQAAGQAINYAKPANSLITSGVKQGGKMFAGGAGSTGFPINPSGFSLGGADAAGSQFSSDLTLGKFGTPDYEGLNFNLGDMPTQAPTEIPTEGLSLSGDTAGAGAGVGEIAGQVGGGIGGALTLAALIQSMTSGNYDNSKTGAIPMAAMSLLTSALPLIGAGPLSLAMLPMAIPSIISLIHMLGPDDKLPYDSSNVSQFKSRAAADALPGQLNDWMLGQNNPMSLLALATGANPLSPNQEVLMRAGGNNWGSDPYNAMLEGVLNQDPQATQDFLRSVEITSGETGGVHNPNAMATDTYRRQLAHALGLTPEQTAGMFGQEQYGGLAGLLGNDVASMGQYDEPGLQRMIDAMPSYADPNYSNFGNYSPFYRDPALGRLTPEEAAAFQGMLQGELGREQVAQTGVTDDPYLQSLIAAGFNPRTGQYRGGAGDGGGDGGGGL